MKNFDTAFSK